jgi:hypothetical protein
MDVRLSRHRIDALADDTNRCAFEDRFTFGDARRSELEQGHGVPVGCLDRDRAATTGHETGERDGAGGRREHRRAHLGADVDAAVLPRGVGVRPEREGAQHRPVRRPGPGGGCWNSEQERQDHRDGTESAHRAPPSLS